MKYHNLQMSRWMSFWMMALTALVMGRGVARATDPIFQNTQALYYTIPGNPPPQFDVTAFDNENIFSVSYNIYTPYPQLFQTLNTLNYTNNGTMIVNTPNSTNGIIATGAGFNFDLHTTNVIPDARAASFYNAGDIRVNSTNDGNGLFDFGGFTFFLSTGTAECYINATNIYNPGVIDSGPGGLIQMNCQNANLNYGTLNIEAPLDVASLFSINNFFQTIPNINSFGAAGIDTNLDWIPGQDLTSTAALTSLPFAYQFFLTNSTPYYQVDVIDASNVIVRAIFIENQNPAVPYSIFFGNNVVGTGTATVEWQGPYQDPATGSILTNYLYLNDDYLMGTTTTNDFIFNGVPENFTYVETTSPLSLGTPVASSFPFSFQPLNLPVTNNPYAYVNTQFIPSTTATNANPGSNPNGALTNMTGRIQITATNDLSLINSVIYGQNYMSLTAPNQFDGSAGALIISPYSDINIGVTNGYLLVTNLLAGSVPTWNGNVTAWSTRYTNNVGGVNYDWRALVVSSSLNPLSQAWVQNLRLHGTNSVEIHDVLNVYRSMYIDAQNLTIATNGIGNGANSFAGQLNWYNTATLNTVQLPNLLWLTNNSSILALGTAVFGSSALPYGAFINNGLLADGGTAIWATNFVNGGSITNGVGSFTLLANSATVTNSSIYAGADLTIAANTLFVTNATMVAKRMLQLTVTNLLTDTSSTTNGNIFVVGTAGISGSDGGFDLPIKPLAGDLLGTTVTNIAPANKNIQNVWAGIDRGVSNSGFSNNMAIGHMVFDTFGTGSQYGRYTFNAAGVSNAIYVDEIELRDSATNFDNNGNALAFSAFNNVVIYYAEALVNGVSVAEKLNHKNSNHLRWVPTYAGIFSGTNIVYPPGVTNRVNFALANSTDLDSNGNGTPNATDPQAVFVPSQLNFALAVTNLPPKAIRLTWQSIPASTNYVLYTTNLTGGNWFVLTNFISPTNVPPVTGWPLTNTVYDVISTSYQKFYQVHVDPNTVNLYGP